LNQGIDQKAKVLEVEKEESFLKMDSMEINSKNTLATLTPPTQLKT
jgi:hypothetical protein